MMIIEATLVLWVKTIHKRLDEVLFRLSPDLISEYQMEFKNDCAYSDSEGNLFKLFVTLELVIRVMLNLE